MKPEPIFEVTYKVGGAYPTLVGDEQREAYFENLRLFREGVRTLLEGYRGRAPDPYCDRLEGLLHDIETSRWGIDRRVEK